MIKTNRPKAALIYDFDHTLSPKDMQEYTFIPDCGTDPDTFWKKAAVLTTEEGVDQILASMYMMLKSAKEAGIPMTKEYLRGIGSRIELFPGVTEWFDAVARLADEIGIQVEHYIISAGVKEMIEGSAIAKHFTKIYASSYYYDRVDKSPLWPAQVVNFANKTQFLFRINKGVLADTDERINDGMSEHERRIPSRNLIYIGDSLTDIPCMKLVKENGGHSIGVYHPDDPKKGASRELLEDNRVNFCLPADYREGGDLYRVIEVILKKLTAASDLDRLSALQKSEL